MPFDQGYDHFLWYGNFPLHVSVLVWKSITPNEMPINDFIEVIVRIFCCSKGKFSAFILLVYIHPRLTRLFSAISGKGKLRKHLSKSGSLLMSRSLEVKSKGTTGAFSPTEIGNRLHHGSWEKVLAVTFSCLGNRSWWVHILPQKSVNVKSSSN